MKKLFTLLMTGVMACSLVACGSGSNKQDTLIAGTPDITGDFMDGFGNSAYDKYVKDMLHGYQTYYANAEGEFKLDPTAVKEVQTVADEAGNKTYTFKLNEKLKWSDGKKVTAKDYVFGLLWTCSDEWAAAGASTENNQGVLGYEAFVHGWKTEAEGGVLTETTFKDDEKNGTAVKQATAFYDNLKETVSEDNLNKYVIFDGTTLKTWSEPDGDSGTFEGVKLIGDYEFSVTLDAAKLPFFYELYYAQCTPYPMHVLAPKAKIENTDTGAKLVAKDLSADMAKAASGKSSYRKAPSVTSGPYKFVSFKNKQVTVEINDKYAGDYDGDKPSIPIVIIKKVNTTVDMDTLVKGDIDVLAGVVEGDKIEKGKKDKNLAYSNFSRNGYGNVALANEFGPTADINVRHAMAYIIDNDVLIQNVLGGYGTSVNGDYGVAQWMYQDNKEAIDGLNSYAFSIENANAALDASDYKYEADGVTLWDATKASTDYYRHNSKGVVLEIKHFGSEDNVVTDTLETQFKENAPKVGMKISVTRGDFDALLNNYYYRYAQTDAEKFHSFNLATQITAVYDPYVTYSSKYFNTWQNATQTNDPEIDRLSKELREIDPTDKVAYAAKWLEFQTYWNEFLPQIPVYSNSYFDFHNKDLKGFKTGPLQDFSQIISKISWKK